MPTDSKKGADRIGDVLDGRYELVSVLGAGMTGTVYEGRHRYMERRVAVKVMHQQLVSDEQAVARFLREARAIGKIGHPAIVEVVDAGRTTDERPFVVLEFLAGWSVGAALREHGRIPFDQLTTIAADLLGGLAAAHSVGIVHRDLKPDNLFILESPAPGTSMKILDFGVAKNLESTGASGVLTHPGSTVGTPSYMSPEQARAQPIDHRTDLWSVGAVLFHCAAGRPPFVEPNISSLLIKLVTQVPPRLRELCPDAPESLQAAVDGALLPDPKRRWSDAAAMRSALVG